MGVWFIVLMEKTVITCCEKTKKLRQWAWRHKCCTLLIAWPIVANWDIWLAYTATPIRCAMLGDDRMQVFVTREEWQRRYPNPLKVSEGENSWLWVKDKDLGEEIKVKYPAKMEYKGYVYDIDFISRKYPNLIKYTYFDWEYKYFTLHSRLYYDNEEKRIIAVSYEIRGEYKMPLYDEYPSIGCDLTRDLNFDLSYYLDSY